MFVTSLIKLFIVHFIVPLLKRNILLAFAFFICSVVAYAQPNVYFVRQTGVLGKAALDGSNLNNPTILNNTIGQGNGVALDLINGKVYYSDGAGGTIKRSNLDGTGEEVVVADADGPFGLELDLTNNRLYWVSRNDGEIQYVDLANTSTINTLATIGGDFSVTVLVDPNSNKVYWDHAGTGQNDGEIICYNLSTNTQTTILSGLSFPSGMVIFENMIYWGDFNDRTIYRANLDGTNMVTIESNILGRPIGLAIDNGTRKIYVSEQNGNQDIYCSDIDDLSDDNVQIVDGSGVPEHIALALSFAEITITGNGSDIADSETCDATPSASNSTDFGSFLVDGATSTNTYTIQNEGTLELNLTNSSSLVTIGGVNSSDFIVTQQPASSTAPNGSTFFQIQFDPSAVGLREATVTIINNDCSEATFCFNIQGTGLACPDFSTTTPATVVIQESTCTTFNGTPEGGSIIAPENTSCPVGSSLQYATDNMNFSENIPSYNQTTSQTIYTKCVCDETNSTTSESVSVMTSPEACPGCPNLSTTIPATVVIQESTCSTFNGTPEGGSITAPENTNCPTGSTLQYATDDMNFSENVPSYNQTTNQTIYTKCVCDETNFTTSESVFVRTNPASDCIPLSASDFSITDPCNCDNPNNITLPDGRFLFQDVLKVPTGTGLTVTLTNNDGNLFNSNGDAISATTAFTEVSTGNYELEFYTLPNQPATITVSNSLSTQSFTTMSCTICTVTETIPTLQQWGLLIYGLLIMNLSLIALRLFSIEK